MIPAYARQDTIDQSIRRTQLRLVSLMDELEKARKPAKVKKIDIKREREWLARMVAIRRTQYTTRKVA